MNKSASLPAPFEPEAIDRRPLHRVIADAIRGQIAAGDLQPGDPLPSEHDLMERFGVSRGTVRQARAALLADGTVGGSQGRHFSVRGLPLTQPLNELVSFTAWARGLGRDPSGRTVTFAAGPSTPEEATALGVDEGATVWRLVRVRLADGEPLMVERTVFPDPVGRLLEGVDLGRESVYAELQRQGTSVASARHLVDAIAASPEDAGFLGIEAGTPLLRVRRTAFTPAGVPLETSDDRYRGDRTNFAIENTSATGMARRLS